MERLQKKIANAGITSRRKAEELIKNGKVLVNGKVVKELGTKVSDKDSVVVDGITLKKEEKKYYLLYKPRGVISSVSDDKGRQTVVDLIDTNARIYPIGRLDYDTSGIILLTNDGEFANIIMHPKNEVSKKYVAKIKGILLKEDINKLKSGLIIDGSKIKVSKVKVRKQNDTSSIVELVVHEGQNHLIKKIFKKLGKDVVKLKREEIAFLNLDGLRPNDYRTLTIKEVKQLYNLKK